MSSATTYNSFFNKTISKLARRRPKRGKISDEKKRAKGVK